MGYLKIHCGYCHGSWEVYSRDPWKDEQYRTCPHCFKEIDNQNWKNFIVPAFCTMQDANRELIKTHTGQHSPLFTVDYTEDFVFHDTRSETDIAIANLQDNMDELQTTMAALAEAVLVTRIEKEIDEL